LIALNSNSDYPGQNSLKYEIRAVLEKKGMEGSIRRVTYFLPNKKPLSFTTYFWKKETYIDALKKAGFKKIQWHPMVVSQKGIDLLGKEFWKELIEHPFICGLTAIKS